MTEDYRIHDVEQTFGDGVETVIIVPVRYPCVRFRVRVGTGWGDEGDGPTNEAPLREHSDEILTHIEEYFDLRALCLEYYDVPTHPDALREWQSEDWDLFADGYGWYEA